MLDNLREEASASNFFEDSESDFNFTETRRRSLLGMSAQQRFILSLLLLLTIFILGAFCLLITERIIPPFLY
ncbi:MAG: hypothetical protein AB1345_00615 [Chloroflexota bacterium]